MSYTATRSEAPFEQEQIVAWRKINILNGDSLVWADEATDWVKLDSIIDRLPATLDWWWNDATALLRPEKDQKGTQVSTSKVAEAKLPFTSHLRRLGKRLGPLTLPKLVCWIAGVLILIFLLSPSLWLSVGLLVFFVMAALFGCALTGLEGGLTAGCVLAVLIAIIGGVFINVRFPEEIERQVANHPKPERIGAPRETDGVFESAREKLDKRLPLNEREEKRIYDILTYDEKKRIEEIERRNGERP